MIGSKQYKQLSVIQLNFQNNFILDLYINPLTLEIAIITLTELWVD